MDEKAKLGIMTIFYLLASGKIGQYLQEQIRLQVIDGKLTMNVSEIYLIRSTKIFYEGKIHMKLCLKKFQNSTNKIQ